MQVRLGHVILVAVAAASTGKGSAYTEPSKCWYNNRLYGEGQEIELYGQQCSVIVCRYNKVTLEALEGCTCTRGAARAADAPAWRRLADAGNEVAGKENATADWESDGNDVDVRDDSYDDRVYGTSRNKHSLDFNSTEEEREDVIDMYNPIPVGALHIPNPPDYIEPEESTTTVATTTKSYDYNKRRHRCRLNGWYPRLTDGTLQLLEENCIRMVCSRREGGGKPRLEVQHSGQCLCSHDD